MEGTVTVREVMTRDYLGVSEGDTVAGAAALMVEADADCAVVLRGGDPAGALTDRDVLRMVAGDADLAETAVGAAATADPPRVAADSTLPEAAAAMAAAGSRLALVTDGDGLAGVLAARDLVSTPDWLAPAGGTTAPEDAGAGGAVAGAAPDAVGDPEAFSAQSVCERCGTLTDDLRNFNGQLVCAGCRET